MGRLSDTAEQLGTYPRGRRTTFSCVFEGFSRELSSHYIINTNCNASLFANTPSKKSPICDPKVCILDDARGRVSQLTRIRYCDA